MRRPCKRKAIDDIVTALLKEEADEIKHKDFGTDEFNTNQMQTEMKELKVGLDCQD